MIRHLVTLLALTTLLSSGLATLLDHEHRAGDALVETTCVVDHEAAHDGLAPGSRPIVLPAGEGHSHPCVACHSSRVRATAAVATDLLAIGTRSLSLEHARDRGWGLTGLLANFPPRGPPLS